MEINRYHIFCNTALRSSGTSNEFSIALNPPLIKSDPHSYFVAQVVSVEIPYSWTQVNSSNNTLRFTYQVNGGILNTYTMTIPAGNYNVNTLMTAYGTAMNLALTNAGITKSWTHNLTYDSSSGKIAFNIANASAYSLVYISPLFTENTFLGRMFGAYVVGSTTNSRYGWDTAVYVTVVSNTTINVNPVSSIYIRSPNLHQVANQENIVAGYKADPSDILCKLQIYTQPRSIIFYNGELGFSCKLTNPLIDKLDIYLSDNYTFGLDMKGVDWSFRITFIEYMPYNLGEGYKMTKHLSGKFNNQPGTIDDLANTDEGATKQEVFVPQDTMRIKKFQRE